MDVPEPEKNWCLVHGPREACAAATAGVCRPAIATVPKLPSEADGPCPRCGEPVRFRGDARRPQGEYDPDEYVHTPRGSLEACGHEIRLGADGSIHWAPFDGIEA